MKPTKQATTALLTTLTLTLTLALTTTASAEKQPNILPTGTGEAPLTFTSSSGTSTFGNGLLKLTSPKSTGTGAGNAEKSGTFDILLQEVKDALGRTCTGLFNSETKEGDLTEGSVLVKGTFHIRDYKLGAELRVAQIWLLKEVHFSCGTLLVVWRACMAGDVTSKGGLAKELKVTLTKEGADNAIIKVLNEENAAEENCEPSSSTDEKAFELSSLETTQELSGFKKAGAATEVLVMPIASAEKQPNILPTGTAAGPLTFTSSSGTSAFGNGLLKLTSPKSKGTGAGNAAKLGTFDILFEGVKDGLGRTCTGLFNSETKEGDLTEGSVLVKGTYHIRDYKLGAELRVAQIWLLKEAHFSCGALLVVWRACMAGDLAPREVLAKELKVTLTKEGVDNAIIKVLNEENAAEENCEPSSSTDEKAFELSSLETTQELSGFKKAGAATEVLVMPIASAEKQPNILPTGTGEAPLTFSTKSGTSVFGNGLLKLTSPKSTGTGAGNAEKAGSFDILFEGVKDGLGRTCTGLFNSETKEGDLTEGSVLVKGTYHIRDYKLGAELRVAQIWLLKEAHFSCGSLLVIWRGCMAGDLAPKEGLTKALTVTQKKEGADNTIIKVLNEENTAEESCELTSSTDEKAFELSSLETTQELSGFKKFGAATEVLVMPL
jgi:hypothetical protein